MLHRNLPPSHPGEILREMFIKEHKLTITEVAAGLKPDQHFDSSILSRLANHSPALMQRMKAVRGASNPLNALHSITSGKSIHRLHAR